MEFDKNKILTVVTADQAKVGQKGWFAVLPQYIQETMSGGQEPSVLSNIDLDSPSPFTREGGYAWTLFYPAPEPSYAERQAQWVMQKKVEIGTKVRITRNFTSNEDGSDCVNGTENVHKKGIVGKVGQVETVSNDCVVVNVPSGRWLCPFTVLEVIKEPTYRPFHDDELNDLVGQVVIQKHTGNAMLVIKVVDSGTGKMVSLGGSQKRNAQQLLEGWTFEDGHPCGAKKGIE